jgi:3-isopropylmalate dehydrogenase
MSNLKKIAVLPGDGIGPEVMAQAVKVLEAIQEKFGHSFHLEKGLIGGIAIDKTGSPLPQDTLDLCLASDAVLLGAIGDPKYDDPALNVRPEQGLLGLRKALNLFCNVRPVTAYDRLLEMSPLKVDRIRGVDFVIFRELTGGIYFGKNGRSEDRNYAFDTCEYHRFEIERILHLAFKEAGKRQKKVTLLDKANVLESSRLWREVFNQVKEEYKDISVDYLYIDNACMQMILNPTQFDVIVTSNMFGDIISDEGSVIAGSLGLLPSSSIGEKHCLFEPVHGSWPEGAGKDLANPFAMVLSVAMMLQHFNMDEEASLVRESVQRCIDNEFLTAELSPGAAKSCSEVGDKLKDLILSHKIEMVDNQV